MVLWRVKDKRLDRGKASHDDKVGSRWSFGIVLGLLKGQLVMLISAVAIAISEGVLGRIEIEDFTVLIDQFVVVLSE